MNGLCQAYLIAGAVVWCVSASSQRWSTVPCSCSSTRMDGWNAIGMMYVWQSNIFQKYGLMIHNRWHVVEIHGKYALCGLPEIDLVNLPLVDCLPTVVAASRDSLRVKAQISLKKIVVTRPLKLVVRMPIFGRFSTPKILSSERFCFEGSIFRNTPKILSSGRFCFQGSIFRKCYWGNYVPKVP